MSPGRASRSSLDARLPGQAAEWLLDVTGARRVTSQRVVQALWGGYGALLRLELEGGSHESVVVKIVRPPAATRDEGHARKLRSYEVEATFYREHSSRCGEGCRVARPLGSREVDGARWLVLEDLEPPRRSGEPAPARDDVATCLGWLARFHATFLGEAPTGLWPRGSYWHLKTRRAELARTRDPRLVRAAPAWDRALDQASHRTWIHGDAKRENFCVGPQGVAAVDFQYVGGGPGVIDVAYLLSSMLSPSTCRLRAPGYLEYYFAQLRGALGERHPLGVVDAVEREWRALYPVAWADFYRFLAGWAPGAADGETYARTFAENLLAEDLLADAGGRAD